MQSNQTVVICCAGMGNRLGMNIAKSLVDINGVPLIIRQLEMLKEVEDIKIVVGFQAQKVIDLVGSFRNDITFVYNKDYRTTGTGASFCLGAENSKEMVMSLDGDLLVHPDDMKKILQHKEEFVGGGIPSSEEPWYLKMKIHEGVECVESFTREKSEYEWTGIMKVKRNRLGSGNGHVFQLIEPLLPIPLLSLRTKEIDTLGDYNNAVRWVKNNYID